MKAACTLCILAALLLGVWPAAAEETLRLVVGTQRLLDGGDALERVAVGDPAVADVKVASERELLVTAKAPGSTSLLIWREGAAPERRVLLVESPELEPTPGEGQVQIDLQIVELSRRTLKQAGLNLGRNTGNTAAEIAPPGLLSAITGGVGGFLFESASGFLPIGQAFNLVYGDAGEGLLTTLSILEGNGLARVLAEPSLVVTSGQTATFLSGGEFPIPVVQGTGSSSSVTIEFKEFGVRLMVTPTIVSPERIVLKVAPEVSQLDRNTGVQTGGVSVPGLTTRRADTTLELADGETFVLSGLVNEQWTGRVDKVPLLGDIPLLGALFRTHRFEREDRELLMVVSPRLVRPLAAGEEHPPLPGEEYDDYDPSSLHLLLRERGRFEPGPVGFSP